MKNYCLVLLLMLIAYTTKAQTKPIKIVFDVTSSDVKVHQSTLRHVKLMSENYPNSEFEVVMYGGALEMVLIDKSSVAAEIEKFATNDNVTFMICSMTLNRHNVKKEQLVVGVGSVPDGILEIVEKQSEGWGYIKEAN
ncbi:MAG: DsrE family protein [Cyclobacteriaceae bacterium]|nr:DsrE family protein [Cyclobacteriaceae bacterium]